MAWTSLGNTTYESAYDGNHYGFTVYWEEANVDSTNNTSDVRVKILFIERDGSSSVVGRSWNSDGTITIGNTSISIPKPTRVQSGNSGYWRVNGVDYDESTAWDKSYYTDYVTITHDADGTKSIDIAVSTIVGGYSSPNCTGSWSVDLTKTASPMYGFPKNTSLTYNASAQNPYVVITTDSAGLSGLSGATVSYGTSTSYGYTATTNASGQAYLTSTTLTNVGSTTIYYKATKSGYQDVTGSFTFSITKGTNTWSTNPTGLNGTYNASAQTLVTNTPAAKWGSVEYSTNNSTWSTSKPTSTNAGTGTVYVRVAGTSNYDTISTNCTWKIAQATNSWTTNPTYANANYTGSAITLITNNPAAKFGTVEYSLNNSTWTTTKPTSTNVGSGTVYLRVQATTNYTALATQGTWKINPVEYTVTVYLPNMAYLKNASAAGTITWAKGSSGKAAGSYNSSTGAWTKTFTAGGALDFPTCQSYVNGTTLDIGVTAENSSNNYLMAGYSTSAGGALAYREGKTYNPTTNLTLYPRLIRITFTASSYEYNFDNNNHYIGISPQGANTSKYWISGAGVKIYGDLSTKNAANAPTATTVIVSSATAGSVYNIPASSSTNQAKNAGIWRAGIKVEYAFDSTTVSKTGHTSNNYIKINKVSRNMTVASTSIEMLTNATTTTKITSWDNLDNSAATALVLAATTKAAITPMNVAKNATITIKSGQFPSTINIRCRIAETDNYLEAEKIITLKIKGRGNGVFYYTGSAWQETQPWVYNGTDWSEDFI